MIPQNKPFNVGICFSLNSCACAKPLRSNLRVEMRAFLPALYRDSVTWLKSAFVGVDAISDSVVALHISA
jgi:hypothetical protein